MGSDTASDPQDTTVCSEEELENELHRPRRADRAGDCPECIRRIDIARRRTEARGIRQIERFGAEFKVTRAADVEAFRPRGRDVLVDRRSRDADPAVAPSAARRPREGVDVEPVIDVLVAGHWIADAVRTLVAALPLQ